MKRSLDWLRFFFAPPQFSRRNKFAVDKPLLPDDDSNVRLNHLVGCICWEGAVPERAGMKAQWPQTDWRPHFMFGTLSSTMAGNDALGLLPPATWKTGTTRMPSCAG